MGGDFAEFLGQLPPALILTFCGFMTLMLVALVLLVASMSRKRDDKKRRRAPAPPMTPAVEAASADLPDLDLLLGGLPASDGPARNQPVVPAQPTPAPKPPAPLSEPENVAPAPPEAERAAPVSKPAVSTTPASGPPGQWDLPKFSDFSSEPLKLRGGRPKTPVPEIDLAGAIEAYLQHKVRSTPEFADRSLHVLSAPGGVQIEVDGRFYEAVGDIEDAPTRWFIAQAIEEWQARQ